jgi:sec-independent protein translocase protein TatA
MPSLGPTELIIILVLALVLFGAGKLGDVGSALGKSIREFRRAATDDEPAKEKRPEERPEPPRPS